MGITNVPKQHLKTSVCQYTVSAPVCVTFLIAVGQSVQDGTTHSGRGSPHFFAPYVEIPSHTHLEVGFHGSSEYCQVDEQD